MQPDFDTTKAHSARVYDFYLGGTDHFAVGRETGLKAMQSWPAVRTAVRENRAFLGRAVRYLAGEAGIRQFLDIGSGLPSAENVHEVAHHRLSGPRRDPRSLPSGHEVIEQSHTGLACPVRAHEPGDLAFGNAQAAVPERPRPSVPLAEVVRLDDGGHAAPSANEVRTAVR